MKLRPQLSSKGEKLSLPIGLLTVHRRSSCRLFHNRHTRIAVKTERDAIDVLRVVQNRNYSIAELPGRHGAPNRATNCSGVMPIEPA